MLEHRPLQPICPATSAQLNHDMSTDILEQVLQEVEQEKMMQMSLEGRIQTLSESLSCSNDSDEEYQYVPQQPVPEDVSSQDYADIQAQAHGYQQIFDALTNSRPAIAAAVARQLLLGSQEQNNNSLPLQAFRLLEVMPWHPLAQRYAHGKEEICEWQVFHIQRREWETCLSAFPTFFQTLPIVPLGHANCRPTFTEDNTSFSDWNRSDSSLKESQADTNMHLTHAMLEIASGWADMITSKVQVRQERVLTNASLTKRHILHPKEEYSLPESTTCGTWQWIGRWKLESQFASDDKGEVIDMDGWAYFKKASHLAPTNTNDQPLTEPMLICSCEKEIDILPNLNCAIHRHEPILRRRKWTRDRVLIDYPLASPITKEYLRLSAHTAVMEAGVQQLKQKVDEEYVRYNEVRDEQMDAQERQESDLEYYRCKLERLKGERLGRFKYKVEQLMYKTDDILPIVSDPNEFQALQMALRRSGAITNGILQQGLHFYIYDHFRNIPHVAS